MLKIVEIENSKKETSLEILSQAFSVSKEVDVVGYAKAKINELDMLGAYVDDVLVGGLVYAKDASELYLLGVLKEYRNQKIGQSLLDDFLNLAKENDLSRVTCRVPLSSKEYFENYGFFEVSGTKIDDDFTLIEMEYLFQAKWLGKKVHVVVDHPYGSWHPHIPDLLMPCNMGYVEECLCEDGDSINAYIFGVFEPLEVYEGRVIGILFEKGSSYTRFVVSNHPNFKEEDVVDVIGPLEKEKEMRILFINRSKN